MENFTPVAATIGGIMIGLAVAALFYFNGHILGISNITAQILSNKRSAAERIWRLVFLAGLITGGFVLVLVKPETIGSSPVSLPALAIAGLLVGYGASLGRGCTSGHGICGLSRLSLRSITATVIFMSSGAMTVYIVRHVLGVSV